MKTITISKRFPTKETVNYQHIYAFNTADVDVFNTFKFYLGNREINGKGFREMKKALKDYEYDTLKFSPIRVDINTMTIIDGHRRMTLFKKLLEGGVVDNLLIFVIFDDISQDDDKFDEFVIDINTSQQNWKTNDYVNNYEIRGNESYGRLVKFCKETEGLHNGENYNPSYGCAILAKNRTALKKGTFAVTDEEIEIGKVAMQEALKIKHIIGKNASATGGWIEAYLHQWAVTRNYVLGKMTFEDFLKAVKKKKTNAPMSSGKRSDWEQFYDSCITVADKLLQEKQFCKKPSYSVSMG